MIFWALLFRILSSLFRSNIGGFFTIQNIEYDWNIFLCKNCTYQFYSYDYGIWDESARYANIFIKFNVFVKQRKASKLNFKWILFFLLIFKLCLNEFSNYCKKNTELVIHFLWRLKLFKILFKNDGTTYI